MLPKFIKVMPEDYERVLLAMKKQKKEDCREMMRYKLHSKRMWLPDINQITDDYMGKPTGFLENERKSIPDRKPLERIKD